MLVAAFAVLSVAALLGLWLAGTRPADRGGFGWWPLTHGGVGAAGLLCLALAWQRAALGGRFAADCVGLIATGLLLGVGMALLAWRGRRVSMTAILVHAALAGIGYLMVAGFVFG